MIKTQMTIEVFCRNGEYFAREVLTDITVSHSLMIFAVNQMTGESMEELRIRACRILSTWAEIKDAEAEGDE